MVLEMLCYAFLGYVHYTQLYSALGIVQLNLRCDVLLTNGGPLPMVFVEVFETAVYVISIGLMDFKWNQSGSWWGWLLKLWFPPKNTWLLHHLVLSQASTVIPNIHTVLLGRLEVYVEEKYKDSLRRQGRADQLADVDIISALDLLCEQGQWAKCLETAKPHGPQVLHKYIALYATQLIKVTL